MKQYNLLKIQSQREQKDKILKNLIDHLSTARIQVKNIKPISNTENELEIKLPSGKKSIIIMLYSRLGYPKDVHYAAYLLSRQLRASKRDYGIIAAPYISEMSSGILRNNKLGFIDASGNCYFRSGDLKIDIHNGNKYPEKQEQVNLFKGKAARVLKVLISNPDKEWTLQELSIESKVSIGEVYRIREKLSSENLLKKTGHRMNFKMIRDKQLFKMILDRWTRDYNFLADNKFFYYDSPLDLEDLENKLARILLDSKFPFALTATSGQRFVFNFIRYNEGYLYIRDLPSPRLFHKLEKDLKLTRNNKSGKIAFVQPEDEFVFYKTQESKGIPIVSDLQLYLDLYQYPPRGQEVSDLILTTWFLKIS